MPLHAHCNRIVADSADALRDMALAVLCIAELPAFLIADNLADERLVVVLPDHGRPVSIPISSNFRHAAWGRGSRSCIRAAVLAVHLSQQMSVAVADPRYVGG